MAKYGKVELTYGFAGSALTRKIRRQIAPQLDQHAGYERLPSGEFLCPRLGQAADFRVPGQASIEVARYIVASLRYDRLYYYGSEQPLHVSIGPERTMSVCVMRELSGRRIPQRVQPSKL